MTNMDPLLESTEDDHLYGFKLFSVCNTVSRHDPSLFEPGSVGSTHRQSSWSLQSMMPNYGDTQGSLECLVRHEPHHHHDKKHMEILMLSVRRRVCPRLGYYSECLGLHS